MKIAFLIFLSLGVASSAHAACSVFEAQMIATVKEVNSQGRVKAGMPCLYGIKRFDFFRENILCPLFIDEAIKYEFYDQTCHLKDGDKISGVLVINSTGLLKLED